MGKKKRKSDAELEQNLFGAEPVEEAKQKRAGTTAFKARKRKRKREEEDLEKTLFGDTDLMGRFGEEDVPAQKKAKTSKKKQKKKQKKQVDDETEVKQPAWHDEDDGEVVVDLTRANRTKKLRKSHAETEVTGQDLTERLRQQFNSVAASTSWADEREEDQDDGLLQTGARLLSAHRSRLEQGTVNVTRMKDLNHQEPSKGVIQSVQFHPNGQMAMTAGFDQTLRFFAVDGERNTKLQSVYLEKFPIHTAKFTPDGSEVIAASRRHYFYVYDIGRGSVMRGHRLMGRDEKSIEKFVMPRGGGDTMAFLGNSGTILLTSLKSKRLIGTMKMNGDIRNAAFSHDGKELVTSGGDGEVYIWDVASRRCIQRYRDEGSLKATSLDVSLNGRYHATGDDSGVVNVYNAEDVMKSKTPSPVRAVMNLTTKATITKFNPDAQMLAIGSNMKKDSLRLVHLPSMTVFANWPSSKTPLHYVSDVDFSPGGGYLAIGNDRGRALLYRLNHFSST